MTPGKALRAGVAVFGMLLALVSGCSGNKGQDAKASPSPVDAGPLVGSAPYWCDVISQQALRQLSGITIPLKESNDGIPSTRGICLIMGGYTRASFAWDMESSERILDTARKNFGRHQLAELPADLGTGLIAYTGRPPESSPYYTMMVFRCGKNRPWISIDLTEVTKGRDAVQGLTELLRIARDRFGVIHGCTPSAK